jgi:hypothetical protein
MRAREARLTIGMRSSNVYDHTHRESYTVTTWLNTPIEMEFRIIDGLSIRFAASEERADHALLLSP